MMKLNSPLRKDLLASFPVFLLAVPLCLAIAHASGLPLLSGLWSGVIGGVIASMVSQSRVGIIGPSAGLIAIAVASLSQLGSAPAFFTCVFLAGIMQILFSYFHAGFLARFIPSSVLKGIMCALGLILILTELPHLVGYNPENLGFLDSFLSSGSLLPGDQDTIGALENTPQYFHWGSLIVGNVAFFTYIFWYAIQKKVKALGRLEFIPPALAAVAAGVVTSLLFSRVGGGLALTADQFVDLPNLMRDHQLASLFTYPDFSILTESKPYQIAFMIALIASIEGLVTVELLDKLDPRKRHTSLNREMFAQGIGNVLAGSIGALPMTSVLARGTINLNSGAQTRRAAVYQGGFILITVLFFSEATHIIPLAALAAVLIATGFRLAQVSELPSMLKKGAYHYVPFFVTVLAIMTTNLLVGICAGLISAALFILRVSYYQSAFQTYQAGRLHRITLGEDVSFLLKPKLAYVLNNIPRNSIVEIDGSKAAHLDTDVLEVISDFLQRSKLRNIEVVIGGIPSLEHHQKEVNALMEKQYDSLLKNNKIWVEEKNAEDPTFFKKLSEGQSPQFMFIGCSDSRVPLETITKADPGDMFIHRNIANVVNLSDVNFLSVLQYSVEVLNVRHIVVCGHYGCGGVKAALSHKSLGLIDNWILSVKMSVKDHQKELAAIEDPVLREKRAIELHVLQQMKNLYKNPIVQNAIGKYGFPKIHGWVYDIGSGFITELDSQLDQKRDIEEVFRFDLK